MTKDLRPYGWAAGLVGIATAVGAALRFALSLPDVAMLYVSAIVLVAVRHGRGPSTASAALAVVSYNFFFVPPEYTFDVAHPSHLLTFAVMFAMGLLVSGLTARIRSREGDARRVELRARTEELRSSLLSAVSHDLRTPLAVITGAATTLRDGGGALDEPRRAELLSTLCEEAERMERLVTNLLDMTRLDAGVVIGREWVPLEEVVGTAIARVDARLGRRLVTTHLPPDLPLVSVDPLLFERVLVNLLENAAKHTPEGTPIEIGAAVKDDAVEISVSDRGPGLLPGAEEQLFEKFFRNAQPGAAGVGLGLSICRSIVEAHGGTISARNREGGGAVFRVTLPSTGAPPPPPPQAEPAGAEVEDP